MMFIHRGDSFGSTGNLSRRSRVPDLILGDDDVGYTPLPCIQVTQVLDRAERDPVVETVRRASEGLLGESQASAGGPQKATLKARPSGRTSRRVSLIPGEALEQAHAAIEREHQQNQSNSSLLSSPAASRKNSTSGFSASFEQALRSSLQQQQIELQQQQQQHQQQQQLFSSKSYEYDSYDGDRRDSENRGDFIRNGDTLDCSIISPNRMKSNQRWLKLRTTVQLSGALSTSMNRAKPTLKREDSFIKRFSTRQIAELQDTVDHTDEEEICKNSSGSPKVRRKKRPRRPRSVINPYGNVYFYWLCILTICVLYNFWTGIVRQAFPELQTGYQTLWFVLDGFTDLTYALDIAVQFRTGYLEQGLIVYDHKKLADHYMHSKCFLFDIFTILPLDILQIPLGMNPMLRFPRFIKVYRVYNYYYMVESRTLYPNFWRVLNLVHILLLLAHWFGCFYYMLSEAENFKGDWTYPYTYGREFRTLTRKYLGSVYWSTLTLTTIGDLPTPESDKHIRRPTMIDEKDGSTIIYKSTSVFEFENKENYTKELANLPFDRGPISSYSRNLIVNATPSASYLNSTLKYLSSKSKKRFMKRDYPIYTKRRYTWIPLGNRRRNFAYFGRKNRKIKQVFTTKFYGSKFWNKTKSKYYFRKSNRRLFNRVWTFTKSFNNDKDIYNSSLKLKHVRTRRSIQSNYYNDTMNIHRHKWRTSHWNIFYTQPSHSSETIEDTNRTISSKLYSNTSEGVPLVPRRRRGFRSRLLHIQTNTGYIFTITSYLIGVFIFATIVGQVGNVITNRNANRLEFERLLDGAKLYMRHHKVPREMQRRVQRWYDYSWSRGRIQGGGDINSALGLLPDKLRTELALHVNLSTLKKVSIFKECQPEFLHDLVLKMKAYIFTPGDLICRKGEVAREMFIIADGILEVISELGKVLTTMKAGDFFGEIGILNLDGLNKRTADVRSVGYSELFSLSREDVLAAMKDYPEAQEILQSLGHKRLKEARHQNCRPEIITPSSKILSSPSKGDGKDEKQPKKLVSRIRSDVSAIRNAFRKSRAMTKENETVELEPLNDDGKEFHENENETPSVKKILRFPRQMTLPAKREAFRRLGRTVGSGGSDGSFKISRGILKRMSHVTSDENNSQNQNKTIVEDQGVLGAGLPLLQRLKLLKEKEEREEREKRIPDSDSKSKRSLSQKRLKEFSMSLSHESTKDEVSKSEEEPEVIGAGLPLFARLRLLKVKEEKEKMQSQTQGSKIKGSSIDSVHSSDRSSECSVLLPKKIEKSLSVDSRSSSSDSKTKDSTEKSTSVFKSKLKSVINQTKDPPSICVVSPSRKEDSKEEDAKINDLNKGTNMSGKLSPQSSSNGQTETNAIENQQSSRDSSSSDPSFSKSINIKLNVQETNQMSNSNVGETHSPISPTSLSVDDTSRDKIQRSESFRKAMDSDLIEESEEGELNIQDLSSKDENSVESERTKEIEEEYKDERDNKEQRSNKDNSTELTKSSSSDSEINILRNGREKTNFPKAKIDSSPEDNNSKAANSSLRVPSNEISPPLSSPESTETPERKNLKSILKRISRDDSTINLLPQGSADLRRLMKAQTVQGFMARRSKLSKAVSFQRKTLSSPPSTIFDILNSNSKSKFRSRSFDVSNGSRINTNSLPSLIYHQDQVLSPDGVQKVLSKLTSFGVESPCHSEDLVRGVESILRDKIEDVEVAWEARIAALKHEVAIRDETIKILSETIKCLQESSDEIILNRINLEDKTLNDVEIINSKTRDDMDSKRVRTPCLLVQISESSNPSSDEDEPLFMRCNSIESIIHQTPDVSPEGERSVDTKIQESAKKPQFQRQITVCQKQRNSLDSEEEAQQRRKDVVIDFGESSTDDDIYSFSSDDDHVIFSSKSEGFSFSNELDNENSDSVSEMLPDDLEEEPEDLDDLNSVEKGEITDNQLNSQDWEVQMLARQLAKEQRGVARRIDRDIATGKLQSPLAELHEALATDNLTNLTELDLIRLEKIVRKEREKLRQYARMYSLDERPVLEDEFSSLYRSRSQMLLSKSSALCRAGPTERRLSTLLKQLTTLPPSEQFLLDRLVYKSARKRGFSRQQSLCDEHLSSYGESRAFKFGSRANIAMKRSMSMCSPPPEYNTITGQSLIMMDEDSPPLMTKEITKTIGEDGFNERIESSSTTEVVSEIREPFRHSGDATTLNNTSDQNKISLQRETQPLLRPSR